MFYYPAGPFLIARDDYGLLTVDNEFRKSFWRDVNDAEQGIENACGCYVFAIRYGRGIRPWYVGKAERMTFQRECFSADKLNKYNGILRTIKSGTPLLYLYARLTQVRGSYSRATSGKYKDVAFLEKLLISAALRRNKDLLNVKETTLLKSMQVPGMLNTPAGTLTSAARELKQILRY